MEYLLIIGGLISLIIIILLFKLIKNIIKTFFTFVSIVLILSLLIGAIVFIDTRNFVRGIKNNDNLYLLNDEEFVSGFVMQGINATEQINSAQLDILYDDYQEDNYDEILKDRHMFFVFELQSLKGEENNQYVEFLKGISTEFEVDGDYEHIPDPKTVAFIALIADRIRHDPLYLVNSYRQGNLTVYPESITFKLIKMIK